MMNEQSIAESIAKGDRQPSLSVARGSAAARVAGNNCVHVQGCVVAATLHDSWANSLTKAEPGGLCKCGDDSPCLRGVS
jgi:hypothetical protein